MSGVVARRGTWFRRDGRSGRYRLGARHVYTGRHGRSTLSMAGAGRTPPRGQTIRARVAGVGARTRAAFTRASCWVSKEAGRVRFTTRQTPTPSFDNGRILDSGFDQAGFCVHF